MVYTANWGIIYHLPPIKGTRKLHWLQRLVEECLFFESNSKQRWSLNESLGIFLRKNAAIEEKVHWKILAPLFWVICWEMILIDLLETGIAMENPPIEDVFSSDNGDFPISC